ncbi:Ger(x)C family spore germination protein [Effusibacillus lacus]|uniref:Spore gernimation protein n=1 Tax=Effusibacillus lacus TaxID=1348429 RepID=A0A292YJM8_9BACL|nr:Ger(x)C family spore germination protein [Effusibacillus lacus]TCS71633.1 spore germination protein [Effusibacillus lacus]GAX90138.1 spore gernimation protein [Effusibacillus lacus]
MGKNKILLLLTAVLGLTFPVGCWDRVEIEERGFVMAIGLDMAEEANDGQPEEKSDQKKLPQLEATYQVAIPANLQTGGGSGGTGGGEGSGGKSEGKAFMNLTIKGDALFKTVRLAGTRSSRTLYFEHNKLVVIGEELAKTGYLPNVIDMLLRDHEMRRRMKVVVVQGKAKEALNARPVQEKLNSEYLDSLTENFQRTPRMPKEMTIGDLSENLNGKSSFVLQRAIPYKDEVKIVGAAVMHGHDNKLVGWLTGEETEGLSWVTGKMKGGITVAELPSGERVVYEIRRVKTKVIPVVKGGKYHFTIRIDAEGSIGESWAQRDLMDAQFVKEVEQATREQIQRLTSKTFDKLQKELKADVIGLGEELSRKQPKLWEQIKNDWDHGKYYFGNAEIHVEANVQVRFRGVISKVEKSG